MNLVIAENVDLRTVQTLISEAKELGLRVVHRPEVKTNVVDITERLRQQMCVSPEVA